MKRTMFRVIDTKITLISSLKFFFSRNLFYITLNLGVPGRPGAIGAKGEQGIPMVGPTGPKGKL